MRDITKKIGSGKTPKGGKSVYIESGIPFLRSQNINHNSVNFDEIVYITESMNEEMLNSVVTKNDVLLNITGASIGRSAVYNISEYANVNQHVCIIRPNREANPYFIQLNLTSDKGQKKIEINQTGGGREGLNFQQIGKMNFYYPNYNEQSEIASYFKLLDKNINLHLRKINILKRVKQQYLRVMFVRNGKNTPEIRFNGFKDVWEQSTLNSIYKVTMGHSPKSENYTSNPDDYILVQGNADILNGWVFPRVWTTQITSSIPAGSILLSVRAPVGDVGKTAYDVVIGRGIAAIEGEEFLYQLLNKMHLEGYWRRISTGSTFESINSKDIKEALIKLPIEEERKSIGEFLQELDSYITLHQSKLSTLEQLKKSYLRKMFL